ncbi:MAG: hypothetical protein P4L74_01350 [Candidatus Doudnabacteria bacterium]|nr:hypothetical protein [Candidatus Doudnabacteria bacterium]
MENKNLKFNIFKFAGVGVLAILPFFAFAQMAIDPVFNPNQLISDTAFSDTQTFGGAAGIQKFLEIKGSVLANTDPSFLPNLKEPNAILLKQALDDPESSLPRLRTAAELIWDAAQSTGLNPQVILATMEKEEGLVDQKYGSAAAQQTAIDHAMGFNCGDNVSCWNLFPGFYYQLFGNLDSSGNRYLGAAKSLMKSFNTSGGRGPSYNGSVSQVGQTIILDNTMGGYDGVTAQENVTLANNATAALYRYTPHVFNGNYNFWKFFTAWFKYPNGTLVTLANGTNTYIIEDGSKQLLLDFVAQARGLNTSSKITLSPNEFADYPTGDLYAPVDNTVVQTPDGKDYVFLNGVKHPASAFVISQRGLSAATALSVNASDASLFATGTILPPKDGTIIRGAVKPQVYLVQNGEIELYSAYTFAQNNIKPKQIVIVPDDEIGTYTQNGFVPPKNGSLVKTAGNSTVYLVQDGLKHAVIADIFKNQGYRQSQVGTITSDEIGALPTAAYAQPKDRTFFAVDSKTGSLYEFKDGVTHPISSFVAKQRGITPDYVFSTAVFVEWYTGVPVPPRDGTLVKGDKDATVYLVKNGQLAGLSAAQFKAGRYSAKKIVTLPQAEVDSYAKANAVTQ